MTVGILTGDVLECLALVEPESVQCVVTSPPYWGLRDYGAAGQIGQEATPAEFVAKLVEVFREVRRVLRPDGVVWLNLGDSYNAYNGNRGPTTSIQGPSSIALPRLPTGSGLTAKGLKPKDLLGIPWRVAFALQEDGWWLRSDVIWAKPNGMPESVQDRPTRAHEYVFLLSKADRYTYHAEAIATPVAPDTAARYGRARRDAAAAPGQVEHHGVLAARPNTTAAPEADPVQVANARDVWTIPPAQFEGAHFATMPEELARRCILAGSAEGDTVLDPFGGAGTTGLVAQRLNRSAVLIELNPAFVEMAAKRIREDAPMFSNVVVA